MVIVAALVSHASRLRHCDLVGEKLCIRISAREHLMTFTIPTCASLVTLGWSIISSRPATCHQCLCSISNHELLPRRAAPARAIPPRCAQTKLKLPVPPSDCIIGSKNPCMTSLEVCGITRATKRNISKTV
jgi:hypothetical protein